MSKQPKDAEIVRLKAELETARRNLRRDHSGACSVLTGGDCSCGWNEGTYNSDDEIADLRKGNERLHTDINDAMVRVGQLGLDHEALIADLRCQLEAAQKQSVIEKSAREDAAALGDAKIRKLENQVQQLAGCDINCPAYFDGCHCAETIADLRRQIEEKDKMIAALQGGFEIAKAALGAK